MDDFNALSSSLRHEIDAAFDKARALPSDPVDTGLVPPAAKRRRLDRNDGEAANYHSGDEDESGGFLVDSEPGGFLDEEDTCSEPRIGNSDVIGLSMIPAAVSKVDSC